jgi:DNA-binding response OmpR family regulator
LCVDDDPNVAAAIARRLRSHAIHVLRAYSGWQGYWELVTGSPDAVVVDLAMPNGSGTELIECMMRNRVTRHIPVIVLTGGGNETSQRRLFQMGISAFLRKPVAIGRLLSELGHYIDLGDLSIQAAER